MTDDLASTTETAEIANVEEIVDDIITIDRRLGTARAMVTLASGVNVSGDWAAGDSQAFRRLIEALVEVADGATARFDRALRQVEDLMSGNRLLRDQLRTALDDIDGLRTQRETAAAAHAHRVGELMAEVTVLRANADGACALVTADLAQERDRLRAAFRTEKQRADTAVTMLRETEDRLRAELELRIDVSGTGVQIRQKAVDAARAAGEAYEEAKWKEGARYLRLANMWISLLNVVVFQEVPPKDPE